jgi:predicted transcriptional regulator
MVFTAGALMNRAISSVGVFLFNKVKNSIFEREQIEKTIIKKTDFESIIEDEIDLEEFPAISHKDIKAICKILSKSKSIELIIKNMYVYQSGMNKSLDEIREDFVLLFPE